MIEVAAAIEHNVLATLFRRALGEKLADLLGALDIGRGLLEGLVHGGGGNQGLAGGVVDDLGVDVLVGVMDGQTRALRGASDLAADAVVNASADRLAVDDAHGAVNDLGLMSALVCYLPTLLPSLRRTFSSE